MKRPVRIHARRAHPVIPAGSELDGASFPVVGIGASAGGLEAFVELLGALPPDTGFSFVLVQHLDPGHPSLLPVLLARATAMPVCEAHEGMRVQRNHVYIIPPNSTLTLEARVLKVRGRGSRGRARSVDAFFESLALDCHEHAIGVVLSGHANDGSAGLGAIKAEGGVTFAQDDSAKQQSMPRHAIEAGWVDFVLSPAGIARELARIAQHPYVRASLPDDLVSADAYAGDESSAGETDGAQPLPRAPTPLTEIVGALRAHTGVDFAFYKPSTILRRIARRTVLSGQETLAAYARSLAGNRRELDQLHADLLIGVTSFFRNPEAFELLKRVVFPHIAPPRSDHVVRIWTLGCSTGQEAYSLAMAYLEFCDGRSGPAPKLQVFATDLAADSLERARRGLYPHAATEISPERLQRFFVEEQGGYRVNNTLREMCTFSRHDLIRDPPFSRMDLVSCRNLMIYLQPELQKQILPSFHYALRESGFLFLGASETVGEFTDLFEPVDKKHRVYRRTPVRTPRLKLRFAPRHPALKHEGGRLAVPPGANAELEAQREADRVTLGRYAPAGVLVDATFHIVQFRGATGRFLEPVTGRASYHVLKMARDGLLLPLREALKRVVASVAPVRTENVLVSHPGGVERIAVEVIPLKNLREHFYLIWFEPTPAPFEQAAGEFAAPPVRRASPRGRAQVPVDDLPRELAETREYLRALQEQHDAAMQEVEVSHEEVQSANEELQSINEELETSKEELVSSFEELTTLNEETVHRNAELNRLNADLNNLHASLDVAIIVVGPDLAIRRFTPAAARLFPLLASDRSQTLEGVRHELERPGLPAEISAVMAQGAETESEVISRAGRRYLLRARPYINGDSKVEGAVLVLLDVHRLQEAEAALRSSEAHFRTLTQNVSALIWTSLPSGEWTFVNQQWLDYTGQSLAHVQTSAANWMMAVHPDDLASIERAYAAGLRSGAGFSMEVRLRGAVGSYRWFLSRATPLLGADGNVSHFLGTATDIEDMKRAQQLMRDHARVLEEAVAARTRELRDTVGELEALSYGVAHDMRAPLRAIRGYTELVMAAHAGSIDDHGRAYLEKITGSARRLDSLIDDVLTYTAILRTELALTPIEPEPMLQELIQSFPELAAHATDITIDSPLPRVLGHEASLAQCFVHLLSNAVTFTAPGVVPRVRVSSEERDDHVRIWIEDNGVGIARRDQERIFNLFERVGNVDPHTGLGIGLAIVRKTLERAKGRVGVESEPGQGSRFWIQVPKAPIQS